jgi:hypothetical protein
MQNLIVDFFRENLGAITANPLLVLSRSSLVQLSADFVSVRMHKGTIEASQFLVST